MKDKKLLIIGTGVAVGGALLWMFAGKSTSKPFHKVVAYQQIRGTDVHGSGAFGAGRGDNDHQGIDIIAQPGQAIYSPVDGVIKRYSYPYSDMSYTGYHITTDAYLIKLWYLAPTLQEGATVKAGQTIGFAQDIGARYPGITPHVHMEVWDLTKNNVNIDPTNLFYN